MPDTAQLSGLEEAQEASEAIERRSPHRVSNTTTSSKDVTADSADKISRRRKNINRRKGEVAEGRVQGQCDIRRSAGWAEDVSGVGEGDGRLEERGQQASSSGAEAEGDSAAIHQRRSVHA
jgi:hypothetical protein